MVYPGYGTKAAVDSWNRRQVVREWFGPNFLLVDMKRVEKLLTLCGGNGMSVIDRLIDEENKIRSIFYADLMLMLSEPTPEPVPVATEPRQPYTDYNPKFIRDMCEAICLTSAKLDNGDVIFQWVLTHKMLTENYNRTLRSPDSIRQKFEQFAGIRTYVNLKGLANIDREEVEHVEILCKKMVRWRDELKVRPSAQLVTEWYDGCVKRGVKRARKARRENRQRQEA